jgi:hypothetical protein
MKTDPILHQKQRAGLVYGLFAGLALALATWGLDAFLLWRAHAVLPWARFVIGGLASMLAFGLAGWLGMRMRNAFWTALVWLAASLLPANLVAPLNFSAWPALVGLLEPGLIVRLADFSVGSQGALTSVFMAIFGVAALIVGGLELPLVEQSLFSTAAGALTGPVLLASIAFIATGLMVDNAIHTKLRESIVNLDHAIQFVAENDVTQLDKATARMMRVAAFKAAGDAVRNPRRLVVAAYSPTFDQVEIWVDFSGAWIYCDTVANQVVNCRLEP